MTSENPYAAPTANLDSSGNDSESVAIRKEHLEHEASIKAVGALYYLGAIMVLLAAVAMLIFATGELEGLTEIPGLGVGLGVLYIALGLAQLGLGYGLRRLAPWVKIPAGIYSGLGLLAFPVGTVINGLILYLLFSKKGRRVLSDDYQQIVAATPDIKYKTPRWVWVVASIMVVLVVIGIAGLMLEA